MVRFGFFVFGGFWAGAKSAKHYADSLPRKLHSNFTENLAKILLNNPFYFISAARPNKIFSQYIMPPVKD
jgi:hypothetical protein